MNIRNCVILIYVIITPIMVYSCASSEEEKYPSCSPSCLKGLECIAGICQPKRCRIQSDCSSDELCFEGRCTLTCDGETICSTGECVDGLCAGIQMCMNGATMPCETACGEGVNRCMNFKWSRCSARTPNMEDICGDGVDDDCDGQVDEGCPDCMDGQIKSCENDCGTGEQLCENDVWSACSTPPPDATGRCPCIDGESIACDSPCGMGTKTCEQGVLSPCMVDGNACDCESGESVRCDAQCGEGYQQCEEGQWGLCTGLTPSQEQCDNATDDDCDGVIDEACEACEATAEATRSWDLYTNLDQRVGLGVISQRIWVSWYWGVSRLSTELETCLFNDSRCENRTSIEIPSSPFLDLITLSAPIIATAEDERTVQLSEINEDQVAWTRSISTTDTFEELRLTGIGNELKVIYRTSDLFLQPVNLTDATLPRRVKVAERINDQGFYPVSGGGRIGIFWSDDSAQFSEGPTLGLITVDADQNQGLAEISITDPMTNNLIFGQSPVGAFQANRYTVIYTRTENNRTQIYSLIVDLDGRVLTPPRKIFQAEEGHSIQQLDMDQQREIRAIVWMEESPMPMTVRSIKLLMIDVEGQPNSRVFTLSSGEERYSPRVQLDEEGNTVIAWTQRAPVFVPELHPDTVTIKRYLHPISCSESSSN